MKNKIVLVSITSASDPNGWVRKVKRISELGIKEAALFPTTLDFEQRKKLYAALEESSLKRLPHVHLRSDMEEWEMDLFVEKYKTQVFNIHPCHSTHPFPDSFLKYKEKIFIENLIAVPEEEELNKYSGLCVDFGHWEGSRRLGNEKYNSRMRQLIKKFIIGCCHISAVKKKAERDAEFSMRFTFDQHFMDDLSDLDYIKKYKELLPQYISIELENSIDEQLVAKKYLEKIINS